MSTTAATHHFNTQSIHAQSQAREAKTLACKGVVDSFDSKTATVEQSQDYARCVNHLYPDQLSDGQTLILKVVIVFCLFCAAFGARHFWKEDYHWFSATLGFFIGICGGVAAVLILAGVIISIGFLFT